MIVEYLRASRLAISDAIDDASFVPAVEAAGKLIADALNEGGKVLIAGNGGSAAQAQHFAGELVGRFKAERDPLPAIALGSDLATLTAIANDYGYEHVFSRQIAAYAGDNTVLVAISTSGQSRNILSAAKTAREFKVPVIAMTGKPGTPLVDEADIAIVAPTSDTPLVQQLHLVAVHLICGLVEAIIWS